MHNIKDLRKNLDKYNKKFSDRNFEFNINKFKSLDNENRKDFYNYVNSKVFFHPFNMHICKSKKMLDTYYKTLFSWLEKCETFFSKKKLDGYDLTRIYAFLAERYLSYWFKKNSNYILWPMKFHDITNDNKNF